MQNWLPVPGSTKARIALVALAEFGARGYGGVGVAQLCAKAGVTTGALYHHFGGKPGLYAFVREEVEQRILDRMEGAAAAVADQGSSPSAALRASLLVGFDAAVHQNVARLLSENSPHGEPDRIVPLLCRLTPGGDVILARILGAAWRAALRESARRGTRAHRAAAAGQARAALNALMAGLTGLPSSTAP